MEDWQNKFKTLELKAKYILDNALHSDCTFKVDGEQIHCHRLILAMSSPVFDAMFYGGMKQDDKPILITDIDAKTFREMLNYIYEEKLSFVSCKNACSVYNAAKKYLLLNLERHCINHLLKWLNKSNVLQIYDFANFHNEIHLKNECLKELQVNTSQILNTKNFLSASESSLSTLLNLDKLNIKSEMELIKAVEYWSFHNSKKPVEIIKKLRFLTLTQDEFVNFAKSTLISDSEKLEIILRIIKPNMSAISEKLCANKEKRKQCHLLRATLIIKEWTNSRCDGSEWMTSIFTTAKEMDLVGVVLKLQVNEYEGLYNENIQVKICEGNDDNIAETNCLGEGIINKRVHYDEMSQVLFNTVIKLEPDHNYSIHIFLCVPGTYPIGRHASLLSSNTAIKFQKHLCWEGSYPWNSTILHSIIYNDV